MTATPCLGGFLDAIFAAVFGGRFFGVARFAVFLRAGLTLAFPRFEAFLRIARRFFAFAMAVPCEVRLGEPISKQSNLPTLSLRNSPHHFLLTLAVGQNAT
jgi:hypothetical protein